jgi:TrmH family RNA methyltransferase
VELFVTDAAAVRHVDLLRAADAADVRITAIADRVAASLSDTVTPQGVVAVVSATPMSLTDVLKRPVRLAVVLVDVADPGNAGTVVRTADAAGADLVVLAGSAVDPHGPKVVRASAGSIFHVPVVTSRDAVEAISALTAAGLTCVAAAADGTDDVFALAADGSLAAPLAWVLGSEAHGLPDAVRAAAGRSARIPIYGQAESLNLATAAGLCLYLGAAAQHRGHSS